MILPYVRMCIWFGVVFMILLAQACVRPVRFSLTYTALSFLCVLP